MTASLSRQPSSYKQRLLLQLLNARQRRTGAAAQGFTLIELLVVIVILGVLGGVG
jgi:prepilin-type N-terminal cleavage/methylation domain-containing protein